MPFDWHRFHADQIQPHAVVDSRRRLGICLVGFGLLLVVVLGRAVQLELTEGAAFRAEATRPVARERSLPGRRGCILARDGAMLACDREVSVLAVHYRYLTAGSVDADWSDRLARLCGLSLDAWNARATRIQLRVERIAESHNRRRLQAAEPQTPSEPSSDSVLGRLGEILLDALQGEPDQSPPAWEPVAEQYDYHVMAEDVSPAAVAEIEGHPEQYPGVKILQRTRRVYPHGPLAAHVLGYLAPVTEEELEQDDAGGGYHAEDYVGRTGLEHRYEPLLRGHRGVAVELTDHGGQPISTHRRCEPGVGRDLILTLDSRLQQAAETLLDDALKRREIRPETSEPAGGAIVVMDVHDGAIRACASAPRFDPNRFVRGQGTELAELLADPAKPLFHRACQMALPPGSVFKTVTAVALLESGQIDPEASFFCQGYLRQEDRQRCQIFRRHGIGHGEVTLADALAYSCNVYFFHHAGASGAGPLVDWAGRFGFGRPTGVDLPAEAAGRLPTPETVGDREGHDWRPGDTESLAVGQGSLTATPLQVLRMMAAVANGGKLVTPHLVSGLGLPEEAGEGTTTEADDPIEVTPPRCVENLSPRTLAAVRAGLDRVVSDPKGTAHGTVYLETVAVAGKTGTAETGTDRADHAWFAGYVPAEQPKLVLVVVLEHAGDAAPAAGPVAKRLVMKMQELGML
ncbi:MAG TPA: penicillin-binding transpeptidase domain-containing protein [Thermoguttaceae bacterium]|nr:penicillin-binding transpeptidase domain-containing protein [Thermoguttaceae bacterium]